MKINNRLKTIGDLVPLSSYPLDIGCDHALLSIYLVKEKDFSKTVASDNKSGPLKKAKENVNFYKVSDKVKLVNAEGLNSYTEGINTITISGMGGLNINKILDDNRKYLKNIDTLILSPNNYSLAVKRKMFYNKLYWKAILRMKEDYIKKDIANYVCCGVMWRNCFRKNNCCGKFKKIF